MSLRLILAIVVLALAGCSGPEHGYVYDKTFTPSHTIWTTICVGKPLVCHPLPVFVGDSWELCLRDGDDEGCVEVDETTYHRVAIGEYFDAERAS